MLQPLAGPKKVVPANAKGTGYMLEVMTSPLILGPIFPHRILTAEVADLKLSLGCFYYMHLTNLLLAHLPHVRNQEVKNEERTQLTFSPMETPVP